MIQTSGFLIGVIVEIKDSSIGKSLFDLTISDFHLNYQLEVFNSSISDLNTFYRE